MASQKVELDKKASQKMTEEKRSIQKAAERGSRGSLEYLQVTVKHLLLLGMEFPDFWPILIQLRGTR